MRQTHDFTNPRSSDNVVAPTPHDSTTTHDRRHP
jgi:hypothetical protein